MTKRVHHRRVGNELVTSRDTGLYESSPEEKVKAVLVIASNCDYAEALAWFDLCGFTRGDVEKAREVIR